ncbi:putative 6-pyruvoyl tetrahydrobiopterin synthase [Campylobacter hyointestinalis]|uniref:6-carboxy-5,6,7,8-tetrahydropterin synthase n=1 Tax=Campylobacter hyointestinalis subsp. hyointestinalis TaxID=91352 RepID=A0A2S5JAW8_CAMHY|nr:6-carboxytetrahydropterin synthase [Campylobacter hyointestinalis]ANE31958.1 6-carboxy-5,6,7,8-tetrahydropterin synthase [Campylobacter hyointestinalis subsp. hyointestinalis LMG 9260]KEA44526.1 6-carboxy-5,6,7,8-tetrahydropterin synthase [Campylobacter hyointestinalis subsp. hyointestinalis]MBT0612223.1 6-carboxytetrahydropterin synthase [Campylobacter hyointestinalis subsp. hyointestinalis]MDL2347159.1 6-carboxytetrahydropterin synthase [Campylobacter hyointestinalis]MDL2348901.1 6-carbox
MIIRKLYDYENAHIVRFCSSKRCKESIHGHSYKCEVLLSSNYLDNAEMVYDFGLMKQGIKTIIDSFDHSTTLYAKDDIGYKNDIKRHSRRWIELPFNPSAEQFSRVFFVLIDRLLELTDMINGEKGVKLHSIIVHETASGYAQCFREDAYNPNMGKINLEDIIFSDGIKEEWDEQDFYENLKNGVKFTNPKEC